MKAFLLTWKSDKWEHEKLREYIDAYARGDTIQQWSCGTTLKSLVVGSRVFLMKQGKGETGIFGSGTVVGQPQPDHHFNAEEKEKGQNTWYVKVDFDRLYDPLNSGVKIKRDELLTLHERVWNSQGSGKTIPDDVANHLETLWRKRVGVRTIPYPDEIGDTEQLFEGAKKPVTVNAYERSAEARAKCLEHWKSSCVVCGFHFEYFFGDIGRGYIHVHHLRPLHEIGEEYEVDPVEDLRPVCPNCHAMLHTREPSLSIEELKERVVKYGKR